MLGEHSGRAFILEERKTLFWSYPTKPFSILVSRPLGRIVCTNFPILDEIVLYLYHLAS